MKLSPYFSTQRMLKEYYDLSYNPTASRSQILEQDNFAKLKELTDWKRKVSNSFSTVQITRLNVDGITSDLMPAGGTVSVSMNVNPGRLDKNELLPEFVLLKRADNNKGDIITSKPFEFKQLLDNGALQYETSFDIAQSGNYSYAVRIMPHSDLLANAQETGLICWG